MERAVAQLGPDDALGLHRFLCDNRNSFIALRPFWSRPLRAGETWPNLICLNCCRSCGHGARSIPTCEGISKTSAFDSASASSPSIWACRRSPAQSFSILSFLEYEHGVFHPVGGCGAVTKAMARIAQELGAHVLLNEPVEE